MIIFCTFLSPAGEIDREDHRHRQRTKLFKASGARFALAALSGALFYLAMKLTPVWWAAWLAPVPVLLAALNSGKSEARVLAWLAAGIGLASEAAHYWKTTGPFATIAIRLLQIWMWSFFVLRTRAVVTNSSGSKILFAFPPSLAGMDTLVSFFSPHGTWGSYAYTQKDATPGHRWPGPLESCFGSDWLPRQLP